MTGQFDVVEATIPQLRAALEEGRVTSEELVRAYQARIAAYDRTGPQLNAVVVEDPDALAAARASDARRARGETLGPLDGIPYTAKDSFMARGLTVAAGSPAFADLVAQRDSFTVGRLRAGGAVLLGLTNMPPMANGGMQRGVYGRAESPYSADFLTSAFASGSSNGSGTATAASFASFGLAEETWSSGRGPASNNGLCAYTPSWGVLSIRGNWPLVPTMDVVVPHTRTMTDMGELLEVLLVDDAETHGDFWRTQPWLNVPATSQIRPESVTTMVHQAQSAPTAVLEGLRIGTPAMFLGADELAGTASDPGIGGPTGRRIHPRPSVLALFDAARADLTAHGADVEQTDLPVVSRYEGDRPGEPTIATRGLVSPDYLRRELLDLAAFAWDDFLRANGDPALDRLQLVDGAQIFPPDPAALPDRYEKFEDDIAAYPEFIRNHPISSLTEIPGMEEGLHGLEATRRIDFEDWLDDLGLDVIAFPAVADVGPADADINPASADLAWRNGVWVAHGNLVWRHLGIPTVTVPMGIMEDTGMPVGITIAGRAYDDMRLLRIAAAFEATGHRRREPPRTPRLPA
ncbi:amidase [Nesterenkonia aerolata]|uniref:Amidase n=1 Tax=Nesterenkonia aerolata TaxID=3074079 RepID=A0ABU2DQX8_9MICC|nr:amidase [Nesterenkonia sp. LY-0111]MDR8018909.1 amidase [Nesterenkonia sp. LY-0111]